ncbi:MAG: alpha/beta hydrolase [Aggregatilineales bacterium]
MINAPLTHDTRDFNGIYLHVVYAGDPEAEPLILLHGFPEFWYAWRNQIDALVNAGFRLIMPDMRGYNLSAKPDGVEDYNLDVLADDVIALMDSTGREKVTIIGHDWGGAIAWHTANKFPERVKKLVVLNVPHNAIFAKSLRESVSQKLKCWYMGFFQLEGIPEKVTGLGNWSVMAWWAFSGSAGFTSDVLAQYRQAWSQPGAMTAMMNYYRAVRRARPKPLPSQRIDDMPVLLIWGKRDRVFSNDLAQASIDLCQHGQVGYIENGTHWVQNDSPDAVNACLLNFLA